MSGGDRLTVVVGTALLVLAMVPSTPDVQVPAAIGVAVLVLIRLCVAWADAIERERWQSPLDGRRCSICREPWERCGCWPDGGA